MGVPFEGSIYQKRNTLENLLLDPKEKKKRRLAKIFSTTKKKPTY